MFRFLPEFRVFCENLPKIPFAHKSETDLKLIGGGIVFSVWNELMGLIEEN